MPKKSAGLLVYRESHAGIEVFLVNPGGPFWVNKDNGVWSIPKGEFLGEEPLDAAKREFKEETGFTASGEFAPLSPVRQSSMKVVYAWAVKGDLDSNAARSNTFSIEWPIGSGSTREFPEVDKAGWFPIKTAKEKILKGQIGLLDQLADLLAKQAGIRQK